MNALRPTGVTADRQARRLTIAWNDGHTSIYSFALLRAGCPCAQCRGGHEAMGGPPAAEIFTTPEADSPATRLEKLEATGAYALTPTWEDGHHYGIYTWTYLRQLCPCPQCRDAGG